MKSVNDRFPGLRPVLVAFFLLLACSSVGTLPLISTAAPSSLQRVPAAYKVSREDELFLEDLEHRSFRYFWDEADPRTGLVPDRVRTDGSTQDENHRNVASIARVTMHEDRPADLNATSPDRSRGFLWILNDAPLTAS